MHQFNFKISDINDLNKILKSDAISHSKTYQSLLVQVFSAHNKSDWYLTIGETIKEIFPDAVIAGATSVGEITEGRIFTNSTAILFSFFESARLNLFSYSCKLGEEEKVGNALRENTKRLNDEIKGMLLLSTPIANDSGKILNTIADYTFQFLEVELAIMRMSVKHWFLMENNVIKKVLWRFVFQVTIYK